LIGELSPLYFKGIKNKNTLNQQDSRCFFIIDEFSQHRVEGQKGQFINLIKLTLKL